MNLAYNAALGRARSGCGGQVPTPEAVLVQYPIVAPQDAYDNGYPIPGFEPKPQPYGVGFTGTACSEPTLLRLAYAFEQATKKRTPPPGLR